MTFKMEDRVRIINANELTNLTGIIVGISFQEYNNTFYIVLLDVPIAHNEQFHRAIPISNFCLTKV